MSQVIRNNQASNAYQRLAFDQFDAPPTPPEEELMQAAPPPPQEESGALEIAPGISLPTLEDVERIHQEAHQEGYNAGYEEGTARGRLEAAELHQLVESMDAALSGLDQEIAEEIQALAIEIARQVVRETLSTRPESILAVIREALTSLPHQSAVIRINPEDMQLVKRFMEEHFSSIEHRVMEDTNVLRGGCVIESSGGQIDAQVQTRWRRVVENLTLSAKDFLDE